MDKKKVIGIAVTAAICLVVVGIIVFGNIRIQDPDENNASAPTASGVTEPAPEQPTTVSLEEYIAQVLDYINANGGLDDNYTKGSIYTDKDGMVYDYTLKQQNAGSTYERVVETVDALFESNDSRYWDAVYELQDSTGVKYQLKVVYHNADGSVIGERTYQ